MAVLINGNGNEAIYAQQDADWFASIMGNQTAITAIGSKFAATLEDANTIGVADGVIITQEGRRIQLDVNEIDLFDIPAGGQGQTNYYIIGYHLVTGDLSEQYCETFVRLMDNATDTIPEDTFRGGADEVFVSLYRVTQDNLAITDMELLLPEITTVAQISQHLSVLIGSQIGAGSKTVSLSANKNKILCIVKKSNVITLSKVIPLSALSANDVIPLGETAPIVGIEPNTPEVGATWTAGLNKNIQAYQGNIGDYRLYTDETTPVGQYSESTIGLAADLSNALGATITYNGNNSFTITSIAGLSVYLYA